MGFPLTSLRCFQFNVHMTQVPQFPFNWSVTPKWLFEKVKLKTQRVEKWISNRAMKIVNLAVTEINFDFKVEACQSRGQRLPEREIQSLRVGWKILLNHQLIASLPLLFHPGPSTQKAFHHFDKRARRKTFPRIRQKIEDARKREWSRRN